MTAFTALLNTAAAADMSTANSIVTTLGGASVGKSTRIGTTLGWVEIYSQGTTTNNVTAGSIGNPDSQGWLYDTSGMLGFSFNPGSWTATIQLYVSAGTATVDVHVRAYKWSHHISPAIDVFVPLADMVATGQGLSTSVATITCTASNVAGGTAFTTPSGSTQEMLYFDVWANITSSSGGSSLTNMVISYSATSGKGNANGQIVTPGYVRTQDARTRFLLSAAKKLDASTRFKAMASKLRHGASRLKVQGQRYQFAVSRLRAAALSPAHDAYTCFRLTSRIFRDGSSRFKQISGTIFRDGIGRFALRQLSAITVLMTSTSSSIIASADTLVTSSSNSTPLTNKNTLIGTATQWGEITANGTSQPWGSGSVAPLPSGNGYFWEASTLEGNVFLPGAWSANLRLNVSSGFIIADIHVRAWLYAAGNYTFITNMVATNQTITTSYTNIAVTSYAFTPSVLCPVGGKLYFDKVANILTNATSIGSATLRTNVANSTTTGNPAVRIITSGYGPPVAISRNAVNRFLMRSVTQYRYAKSRFRQSIPVVKDAVQRLKTMAAIAKNGATRFAQQALRKQDAANRFLLRSARQYQMALTRFAQQSTRKQDASSRFRQSVPVLSSAASRLKQYAVLKRDSMNRFLLRSARQYRDAASRFRLLLIIQCDGINRFKMRSVLQYRNAFARFRQSVPVLSNAIGRFKARALRVLDSVSRFRVSATQRQDAANRFRQSGTIVRLAANRFRLDRKRDAAVLLVFLGYQALNGAMRFVQRGVVTLSAMDRFRLRGALLLGFASRIRLSVTLLKDATSLFRMHSVPLLRDGRGRFRQSIKRPMNANCRLLTYARNPKDARIRFVLRPNRVSSISAAKTEMLFRDGIVEMVYRG